MVAVKRKYWQGTTEMQEEHGKACQCSRRKMMRLCVRVGAAGKEVERLMTTQVWGMEERVLRTNFGMCFRETDSRNL